jgi:hypothetical protein
MTTPKEIPVPRTLADIYQDALKLSPDERENLSNMLAAETETDAFSSPDIEKAWMDEVRRRRQLHAMGKTRDVPSEKVFADMRRKHL